MKICYCCKRKRQTLPVINRDHNTLNVNPTFFRIFGEIVSEEPGLKPRMFSIELHLVLSSLKIKNIEIQSLFQKVKGQFIILSYKHMCIRDYTEVHAVKVLYFLRIFVCPLFLKQERIDLPRQFMTVAHTLGL